MQLKNDTTRYGAVAQLFHWIIVALVITQYVLANKADSLPQGSGKIATLAQHKSVGMTILMLATLRLLWRLANPVPRAPAAMPRWQHAAADISHGLLYALLFLMPLVGWMMSSARNFSVSWFGLFTFPDLVSANESAFKFFQTAHGTLASVLFVIACLHAAAALKHHFIDRDNVLRGMLPVKLKPQGPASTQPHSKRRFAVLYLVTPFVLLIGFSYYATRAQTPVATTQQTQKDTLSFIGTQAGAEFEGAFEKFSADVKFDPKNLASSRFDVTIDTTSVNSNDKERDDTIRSADLFDSTQFPTAHYVAETFTDKGDGNFAGAGKLTLRDITREVPVEFKFERNAGGAWVKGTAAIKRLDFGVGQGSWEDTSTVANEVKIRFAVQAK